MQNNETSNMVDISQLTWAEAAEQLEDSLNEGFKHGAAPDVNRLLAIVGDKVAKLFMENPNIAERDMTVGHNVDMHHPGNLEDPDDCLCFLVPLIFSYVTCAECDCGDEVTLSTEIETLSDAICITFDPEEGYQVALNAKEFCRPLLQEDACVNVLCGCSISDYVDMLEDAFVETEKSNLRSLPESVGARIAVEYCEECGCDVEVTVDEEGDEAQDGGDNSGPK